jgi:hypothetical protein
MVGTSIITDVETSVETSVETDADHLLLKRFGCTNQDMLSALPSVVASYARWRVGFGSDQDTVELVTSFARLVRSPEDGIDADCISGMAFWDFVTHTYGDTSLGVIVAMAKAMAASSLSIPLLICDALHVTLGSFVQRWLRFLMRPPCRLGHSAILEVCDTQFSATLEWDAASVQLRPKNVGVTVVPTSHPELGPCNQLVPTTTAATAGGDELEIRMTLGPCGFHVVDVTERPLSLSLFEVLMPAATTKDAAIIIPVTMVKYDDGSHEVFQNMSPIELPHDRNRSKIVRILLFAVNNCAKPVEDMMWCLLVPSSLCPPSS